MPLAVIKRDKDSIMRLVESTKKVDDTNYAETSIHWAALLGYHEIVEVVFNIL